MKRLISFFTNSFQRKLLFFNLAAVILTTVIMFMYLMYNFRTITDFSLQSSSTSIKQTVQEFLVQFVNDRSNSTWNRLVSAQNNLAVLGQTAQKLQDNNIYLETDPALYGMPLFVTNLHEEKGALTSDSSVPFDTFIPPSLAVGLVNDPRPQQVLQLSSILNLNMDAVFKGNADNVLVYYIGGKSAPVIRAYPNTHLVDVFDKKQLLNYVYWKDLFATNVENWSRWYTDPALQNSIPSPITVEKPAVDPISNDLILTMFYPLWNSQSNAFAGAVGVDYKLNSLLKDVLSIKLAQTGFAFLVDGEGNVLAVSESNSGLFQAKFTKTTLKDLSFYGGSLANSSNSALKDLAAKMQTNESGYESINLVDSSGQVHQEMLAYQSLPSFMNSTYQPEKWKIVAMVPEAEISQAINQTRQAIQQERQRITLISFAIMGLFIILVTLISILFTRTSTRDLRTLSVAAEGISSKNYDVNLKLKSQDEIGHLGQTFMSMAAEIRDYTMNLEGKVAERTADLHQANVEITRLNEQLRGENLRMGAELDVARHLQMMVLPPESETREVPDLDIACFMRPADEVGGDYYDVLKVGDAVYLGIGDVTGHGLSAGVIMMMAQTALLTLSKTGEKDMERMLSVLNRVLYNNIIRIHEDRNMTLAILQYVNKEFSIVGQHETVLICRTSGDVETVDTMNLGLPVGMEENIDGFITTSHIHLDKGDVMVLYTDGATEAINDKKAQYGLPGLKASLARHHKQNSSEIVKRMLADVFAYIGEAKIYDDIALLVIKQK